MCAFGPRGGRFGDSPENSMRVMLGTRLGRIFQRPGEKRHLIDLSPYRETRLIGKMVRLASNGDI